MANLGLLYNGNLYSATSAEVDVDGKRFFAVTSLTLDDELTPEDQYGFGAVAVGRTKGQYKASGELEMMEHEANLLIARLQAKAGAGRGYGEVSFNISANLEESTLGVSTIDVVGARVTKVSDALASGPAGLRKKFTLSIIKPIKRNGASIVADPDANIITLGGAAIGASVSAALAP